MVLFNYVFRTYTRSKDTNATMTDALHTVLSVVVIGVVAVVGLAVLGPVVGIAQDDIGTNSSVIEPAPNSFTFVADGEQSPDSLSVTPSTGTALAVSGATDGFVDIPPPNATTRQDGWALAATVEPLTVDTNNTHVIYAEANATILVQYEAGNYSARYETASGDTAYVTGVASGGRQAVSVEYRNATSQLRLYINGSVVDTATPTAAVEPRQPAYEWDGTIDEFRRWQTPVGDTTHSAYATDPVQVLNTSNATHRVMFNDNDPSEVYYANGNATLLGDTQLVTGVQPPQLTRGTDYEIQTDPIEIRALSGGYLNGAPVVFVEQRGLSQTLASITGGISAAFALIPLLLVTLMARAVVKRIKMLQ